MKTGVILLMIAIIAVVQLIAYSICKAAGDADRRSENMKK